MADHGLDRRDFHKLTMAALSGMVAGATVGCGDNQPDAPNRPSPGPQSTTAGTGLSAEAEALIMDEPHVCRGLNSCKGLGRSKDNSCAGQGTCASIADTTCGGNNACKGQGGCGELAGMNSCKGKGACHIPLMDHAWDKARTAFETAMKKARKPVGAAPEKPKDG